MSYDLVVCVLGQCNIKSQRFGNIYLDVNPNNRNAYIDTFSYMTAQDGAWCSITEKERFFSAMNICDLICSKIKSQVGFPFWINKDVTMYAMQIVSEYQSTVLSILEYLLNLSPQKQILFLPRLQGYEDNNICGVIKFVEFKQLLNEGKILFNICYILEK